MSVVTHLPPQFTAPLLVPDRLAALLESAVPGTAPPVVLDVRWRLGGPPGRADHEAGHVPGAVFVDLDTELAAPPGAGGRHPLPDPAALQEVLRRAGVAQGSRVVAYDDDTGAVAARAWWLLRWAGLPADRVAVLDGGFRAWRAAGLAVTAAPSRPAPGDLVVRPGGMPVVDADGAAVLARNGVLLDARAGARYRGETEPVDARAGHVPGARNAPATEHLGPDGRWQSPEALARHYGALGVRRAAGTAAAGGSDVGPADSFGSDVGPADPSGGDAGPADSSGPDSGPADPSGADAGVAAYCGSGVTATAVVLALEYSGLCPPTRPAALYPGSWSQWSADPGRPAATGAEP
jgi:thiosulfate/3-mercaptopyruvate sulfurtransferase